MPSSSIARVDPAGATPSLHEVRGSRWNACRGVVSVEHECRDDAVAFDSPDHAVGVVGESVEGRTDDERTGRINRRMRHVDPEQAGRPDTDTEDVSGKGSAVLFNHEVLAERRIQHAETRLVHRARRCNRHDSGRDVTHVIR